MAGELKPVVLALMGLPGAGKSSLARELSRALGWRVIDRDAIRAALFADGACGDAEKRAANRAVFEAVGVQLRAGRAVIVDGMTFAGAALRTELEALARACDARLQWLWLDCPVGVAQQRLRGDAGHPAADRTPQLAAEVASRFAPPPADALRLDARQPVKALADAVLPHVARLSRMNTKPAGP